MSGGRDEVLLQAGMFPWSDFRSRVDAVCHLAWLNDNECARSASGFLAKGEINGNQETFIMTNNHFIYSKEIASQVTAAFHFDGRTEPKTVELDPDRFFRTNMELDYSMVGLSDRDVNDLQTVYKTSPVKLTRVPPLAKVGDIIHILQHPGGRQKRMSYEKISEIETTAVSYKASTDAGSSGSPVFWSANNKLFVLALHKTGGAMAVNGELVNKGILMNAILDHVNGHNGPCCSEGPSSRGNESGAFVNAEPGTTNQGLPVVHPQSPVADAFKVTAGSPEPCDVKLSHGSSQPRTGVIQETQSPPNQRVGHMQETGGPSRPQREELCKMPFTARELIRLAQRIPDKWEQVAKLTDQFKDWEITNIKLCPSYHDDILKADKMLNAYQSRLGTRETLAEALLMCGKQEEAKHVRSGYFRNKAQ